MKKAIFEKIQLLLLLWRLINLNSNSLVKPFTSLFVFYLIGVFLEVGGIGASLPFIYSIVNIDDLKNSEYWSPLLIAFGLSENSEIRWFFGSLFVVLIVLSNLGRLSLLAYQTKFVARLGAIISNELFKKIIRLPLDERVKQSSHGLLGVLTHDVNASMGVLNSILTFVSHVIVIFSATIILIYFNPDVTILLVSLFLVIYGLFILGVSKKLRKNSIDIAEGYQNTVRQIQHTTFSTRQIRLNGNEAYFETAHLNAEQQHKIFKANNQIISAAPKYLVEIVVFTLLCSGVLVAFDYGLEANDILPVVGLALVTVARLFPLFQQIYRDLSAIQGATASLNRTFEIIEKEVEDFPKSADRSELKIVSSIEFANVGFSYSSLVESESAKFKIQNLSFEIRNRSITVLTGPSGGGKSTIADILMGLRYPDSGELVIDKQPLTKNKISCWRQNIAHVGQDVYLIDDTVIKNVAFGINDSEIDVERVNWAIQQACLDDVFSKNSMGINSKIGDNGLDLSGGQRQRLGIARALYHNAQLLVLDEATSSLDNSTEDEILETIKSVAKYATVVFITHRITAMKIADKVILIKRGKKIAEGNFDKLQKTCTEFNELLKIV